MHWGTRSGTTVSSEDTPGSPACFAHELDADGRIRVDPRQARDVARWRKAERERLLELRLKLPMAYRESETQAIAARLDEIVPQSPGTLVSTYWPIRAEPDLRPWMRAAVAKGLRVALPVALAVGQPLVFREWREDAVMTRGLWNIPYPADGAVVIPEFILAPLVGHDPACYRLGYGGGFFDRTLAAIRSKRLVIGVGFAQAAIPTIFPQPHDIAMDLIITGGSAPCKGHQ